MEQAEPETEPYNEPWCAPRMAAIKSGRITNESIAIKLLCDNMLSILASDNMLV